MLANLFLHYAFDKWITKQYPALLWCRYADDGLVHCVSEAQAQRLLNAIGERFQACGLTLHPDKTLVVYCKDDNRRGSYENTSFDFLGYSFRPRLSKNNGSGKLFLSFSPAVSKSAMKSMRSKIRILKVKYRADLSLAEVATWLNPYIRGWLRYYGRFCRSAMYPILRQLNSTLVKWAMWKYKGLRGKNTRASQFLQRIAENNPGIFYHWKEEMVGTFV